MAQLLKGGDIGLHIFTKFVYLWSIFLEIIILEEGSPLSLLFCILFIKLTIILYIIAMATKLVTCINIYIPHLSICDPSFGNSFRVLLTPHLPSKGSVVLEVGILGWLLHFDYASPCWWLHHLHIFKGKCCFCQLCHLGLWTNSVTLCDIWMLISRTQSQDCTMSVFMCYILNHKCGTSTLLIGNRLNVIYK